MRRGVGRARIDSEEQEDLLLQSGWMYADLFLALTVIFLATISFVPELGQVGDFNGSKNTSGGITSESSFNYAKGYTLVVPVDQFDQVGTKVSEFLAQEGLDGSTEIIFAQIVGGFDPESEKPSDGQLRAITFAIEINKEYPELLQGAQRYIESSPSVAPGNVALRLTFAQPIPQK
jgi:hypothetical protein